METKERESQSWIETGKRQEEIDFVTDLNDCTVQNSYRIRGISGVTKLDVELLDVVCLQKRNLERDQSTKTLDQTLNKGVHIHIVVAVDEDADRNLAFKIRDTSNKTVGLLCAFTS